MRLPKNDIAMEEQLKGEKKIENMVLNSNLKNN